ncbi:helix-turn-helix transcriptional regulator [Aquipuribacter nitratireducens]|uniref:Helix-turn-helix transcriptional regulator n=1 Tax=Aquipuribacter nitratireducens TaxID=650104 RepID=A0ABW0GKF2_9MICO
MDNRAEVRAFLTTRRARVTPEQAGLPTTGHRRVPGLRRSEVAALAGMSVEYYAKLERGDLAGVSAGILEAIVSALRLDEAERAHLLHLAHEADGTNAILRSRRRARPAAPRPSLQWAVDAVTGGPAIVGNSRQDLLVANHLARAMYHGLDHAGATPPNFARHIFLQPDSRSFYPDWGLAADMCVANLRTAAGKDPHDKDLHDLVGELSTRSDEFRNRWAAHNVRTHGTGVKHFRHPVVGDLALAFESFDLRADPSLSMTIYSAEPGSPSAAALTLLASWAATTDPPIAPVDDRSRTP